MELLVQYKVWYLKCVSFPDHYLKLKHRSQCHISSAHLSAAHILKPHEYLVSFLGTAHDPKLTKALSPPTSLSPDEPTHIWKQLVHTSECLNSVSLLKLHAVRGQLIWKQRNHTCGGKLQSLPGVPGIHKGNKNRHSGNKGTISDSLNYYWIIRLIMYLI